MILRRSLFLYCSLLNITFHINLFYIHLYICLLIELFIIIIINIIICLLYFYASSQYKLMKYVWLRKLTCVAEVSLISIFGIAKTQHCLVVKTIFLSICLYESVLSFELWWFYHMFFIRLIIDHKYCPRSVLRFI